MSSPLPMDAQPARGLAPVFAVGRPCYVIYQLLIVLQCDHCRIRKVATHVHSLAHKSNVADMVL